jgi:DNA-binding MarR family transcriptional regulator
MPDERPRLEPEARALRQLQSAMSEAETALARRMRMHPTDLAAMNHLTWTREAIGPGELGHRLGLSPAAATELVDRLTAAGHVERHRDLADRRRIRLQPSGDAVASVLGHIDSLIAAIEDVARDATEEERATIVRFLQRITAVYEDWADPDRD